MSDTTVDEAALLAEVHSTSGVVTGMERMLQEAKTLRDDAIRAAADAGIGSRPIAAATGSLGHTGVRKIILRDVG